MKTNSFSWITIHLARFETNRVSTEIDATGPATAAAWRVGPDSPIGANGMRTETSNIWAGLGFYHSKEDAGSAMQMARTSIPMVGGSQESWHAMLAVIAHRGEIDLSTEDEPHPSFIPSGESIRGPIAVITSAGYADYSDDDFTRHRSFVAGVEQVREYYASLPANLLCQVFNPTTTPDGCTITIWTGNAEMVEGAYKSGAHKRMLDRHQAAPFFDRSSFTRLSILETHGTWNGRKVPSEIQ